MAQKTPPTKLSKTGQASSLIEGVTIVDVSVKVPSAEPSGLAEHDKWLYENPEALASVKRGLEDLAAGRVRKRRSYAEYANIQVED